VRRILVRNRTRRQHRFGCPMMLSVRRRQCQGMKDVAYALAGLQVHLFVVDMSIVTSPNGGVESSDPGGTGVNRLLEGTRMRLTISRMLTVCGRKVIKTEREERWRWDKLHQGTKLSQGRGVGQVVMGRKKCRRAAQVNKLAEGSRFGQWRGAPSHALKRRPQISGEEDARLCRACPV
jgi:hypothetical protein